MKNANINSIQNESNSADAPLANILGEGPPENKRGLPNPELLHQQRLEIIGSLSSGIAHDLNNMLTPILMSLELLKSKLSDDESRQVIEILKTNVERGSALVRKMLALGSPKPERPRKIDFLSLSADLERLIDQAFPMSINLKLSCTTNLKTVFADPTLIFQAMLNLCVNARNAMPGGGDLTISFRNRTIKRTKTGTRGSISPGAYVVMSFSDTGIGISKEVLKQIFQKYFTTHNSGKGNGLGLSTSADIIEFYNGMIDVQSRVGYGSTFEVYLPAGTDCPADKS